MTEEIIESIAHDATIIDSRPKEGFVIVKIEDQAECSTCAAAKLCNKVSEKNHTINVPTKQASEFKPGDKVVIEGSEQMHRKAIMIATVIPCIILVAVMVGIYLLTFDQLKAVVGGLASTVFFFGVLYACRNKISHEFVFTIKRR